MTPGIEKKHCYWGGASQTIPCNQITRGDNKSHHLLHEPWGLVGGFNPNPSEKKCYSNWMISPGRGENSKNILKFHHLDENLVGLRRDPFWFMT